jgi:hypothetical protein
MPVVSLARYHRKARTRPHARRRRGRRLGPDLADGTDNEVRGEEPDGGEPDNEQIDATDMASITQKDRFGVLMN